jgi:hypothetical protein
MRDLIASPRALLCDKDLIQALEIRCQPSRIMVLNERELEILDGD